LQRGLIMAKTIHIILDSTANVSRQMLKEYADLHIGFSDVDVELYYGGQPNYQWIIRVE